MSSATYEKLDQPHTGIFGTCLVTRHLAGNERTSGNFEHIWTVTQPETTEERHALESTS
jgi:hypothetical protein